MPIYILLGKVRMQLEWFCAKCAKNRAPTVLAMDKDIGQLLPNIRYISTLQ